MEKRDVVDIVVPPRPGPLRTGRAIPYHRKLADPAHVVGYLGWSLYDHAVADAFATKRKPRRVHRRKPPCGFF